MDRDATQFLTRFVKPLVTGGDVFVGAPIDGDDFSQLMLGLAEASPAVDAVNEARHDILAELVLHPPELTFDDDELALAVAVHNILFLSHPRAAATSSAVRRVLGAAAYFAERPPATDRDTALSRHSLLHSLFALTRADTRISWWLGSATFVGQKAPSRLTRLRNLRRVREERVFVGFNELLRTAQAQPILTALLRRSPLTPLLSASADAPAMRIEDATFLFEDAELARAIAYQAIAGSSPLEMLERPAAIGAGIEQMLERRPDQTDVRTIIAFAVYLNALLVLSELERTRRGGGGVPFMAELACERTGNRLRGLSTFLALPNALERVNGRLTRVPGTADDPEFSSRWDRHRVQVAEVVGEGVIEALASRLGRHLWVQAS